MGDAPAGRALKRVRLAESRVDDDAEVPEPTSEPAPSSFLAEAASSSSAATPSTEKALPASAIGVSDQVMSELASSAPHAAIRLSMKRLGDSPRSESETKRHHAGHSTQDVVMLLDGSDVGQAVALCREVCRRSEAFFVDVNDWDCAFRDKLRAFGSDGTTVACSSRVEPPENSCRMNRAFSIFLLLPAAAMAVCREKPSGSVFVNTNVASWERMVIAKNSTQFWSIVFGWKRETS